MIRWKVSLGEVGRINWRKARAKKGNWLSGCYSNFGVRWWWDQGGNGRDGKKTYCLWDIWKVKCIVLGDGWGEAGGEERQVWRLIPRFLPWTSEWVEMYTGRDQEFLSKWQRQDLNLNSLIKIHSVPWGQAVCGTLKFYASVKISLF